MCPLLCPFFTKWKLLNNYEKCFLFHLKSSFCSRNIQICVFLSCILFWPVSHCLTGWLKTNLKVYDVINCLNKNLITAHIVWYLEKEKKCTLKLDKGTLLWKSHAEYTHQMVVPGPFSVLVNYPKTAIACKKKKKKIIKNS